MDVLPAVRVELLCILWQAGMAALAHSSSSSSRRGMSAETPLTAKLLRERQAGKALKCVGLEQKHILFMIDLFLAT